MGIRVEHGPSMVPVGKLAYRTGQNEYIDKRRQELEAQQEQQRNRNLKAQMQVNDINSGFQQIQMQHEQGMQRAAAQNQFNVDRDQKNNDWQVNAAGDLFNRQKDLNDQRHDQGLARAEFTNDLNNKTMVRNNQTQTFTRTIDRLYGSSNQAGRTLINDFQGQMQKLRGHLSEGKITQEDYDSQYSQGSSTLVTSLTDKNSSVYQIGAQYQVGGTSIINGGATKKTIGEGGSFFYEDHLPVDEATGIKMTREDYDLKFNAVQYGEDGIPFRHETDNITGQRKRINMTAEYQAKNKNELDAMKLMIASRENQAKINAGRTVEPATRASVNKEMNDIGNSFDQFNPEPEKLDAGGQPNPLHSQWRQERMTAIENGLSDEQRIAVGRAPALRDDQKVGGVPAQQVGGAAAPAEVDTRTPEEAMNAMPSAGQSTEMVAEPIQRGENEYTMEEARGVAWEQLQKEASGYGLGIADLLDSGPNDINFEAKKQQAIEKQIKAMMEDGSIQISPGETQQFQGEQFDLQQQNKLQLLDSMNV